MRPVFSISGSVPINQLRCAHMTGQHQKNCVWIKVQPTLPISKSQIACLFICVLPPDTFAYLSNVSESDRTNYTFLLSLGVFAKFKQKWWKSRMITNVSKSAQDWKMAQWCIFRMTQKPNLSSSYYLIGASGIESRYSYGGIGAERGLHAFGNQTLTWPLREDGNDTLFPALIWNIVV